MRRFTLARRGFRAVGLVVGDDLESAERRFFDSWMSGETRYSPAAFGSGGAGACCGRRRTRSVIGLFPEPGAPR